MSRSLIKRRSLLQQLGAAAFLATPVFRSAIVEAQAKVPLRYVAVHLPSGVSMLDRNGDLSVKGSSWDYDHYLGGLKDIQSDVVIFNNLGMPTGNVVSSYTELEGHGGGMRTMFTGDTNQRSGEVPGAGSQYGTINSIDQLLANAFGSNTKFGSLQLGAITQTNSNPEGRRCLFKNGTALEPVEDPNATFARLFPGATTPAASSGTMNADPKATAELVALHDAGKSRLDQLKAEILAIKAIAGTDEQSKLDLHLTSLRELENSLPQVGAGTGPIFQGVTCAPPNIGNQGASNNGNSSDDIQELGPAMLELMYQAINCDLTRIATFQWMSTGANNIFPFLNINESHHGLEHSWQDDDQLKASYDRIQTWLMLQTSTFIKRLKSTPEGNGSVLDNTVVFVASEMWGGHQHDEFIALVAGKAGGAINPGRTLDAQGRAHNDLLLSLVNMMGLNVTAVGDPKYVTGPLNLG